MAVVTDKKSGHEGMGIKGSIDQLGSYGYLDQAGNLAGINLYF